MPQRQYAPWQMYTIYILFPVLLLSVPLHTFSVGIWAGLNIVWGLDKQLESRVAVLMADA